MCAGQLPAIPAELMEFFGCAAGAFTGAARKAASAASSPAAAHFLDEVNLLTATMQPKKFLRALRMEIDPVGGEKSIFHRRGDRRLNIPLETLVEADNSAATLLPPQRHPHQAPYCGSGR